MTENEKNLQDLEEWFKMNPTEVAAYEFQKKQLEEEMAREAEQATSAPPPDTAVTVSPPPVQQTAAPVATSAPPPVAESDSGRDARIRALIAKADDAAKNMIAGLNFLVIGDSTEYIEQLVDILCSHKMVRCAGIFKDANQGVTEFKKDRNWSGFVHAIFLDIESRSALKEILDFKTAQKVIMVAPKEDRYNEPVKMCLMGGAKSFLTYPFDREFVLKRVSDVIGLKFT